MESARVSRDLYWNVASFGIVGVSGIALNAVIARAWDASALGVFNQILTFQIMLGQAAVFGIHYSALRHVAAHSHEPDVIQEILGSALLLVLILATLSVGVVHAARHVLASALESPMVAAGLEAALLGFWLVPLNKLLTAALNGLRAMRLFALVQVARPATLFAAVAVLAASDSDSALLPWAFSIAECAVLSACALSFGLLGLGSCLRLRAHRTWMRRHITFGWQAAVAGWCSETQSRTDVLVTGLFLDDRAVGVYSAASTLIEGLAQLPAVLRNVANPLLTQYGLFGKTNELRELQRRFSRLSLWMMVPVCGAAAATYPLYATYVLGDAVYIAAWLPFTCVCIGLALACWIMPFEFFFIQVGHPVSHLLYKLCSLLATVVLLMILVPKLGITGTGIAFGLAFLLSSVVLSRMVARTIPLLSVAR